MLDIFTSSNTGFSNDMPHLYSVSVTHGPAGNRTHIWSFVGAVSESSHPPSCFTCPCINNASTWPYQIPLLLRVICYFCDAAKNGVTIVYSSILHRRPSMGWKGVWSY